MSASHDPREFMNARLPHDKRWPLTYSRNVSSTPYNFSKGNLKSETFLNYFHFHEVTSKNASSSFNIHICTFYYHISGIKLFCYLHL